MKKELMSCKSKKTKAKVMLSVSDDTFSIESNGVSIEISNLSQAVRKLFQICGIEVSIQK